MSLLGSDKNDGVKAAGAGTSASAKSKASRQKRIQEQFKSANALKDELTKQGIFDKLSQDSKNFLVNLCMDPATRTGGASVSTFNKIYGPNPTVGQSVTLDDIYDKTNNGLSTFKVEMKKWAAKGIIIEEVKDPSGKVRNNKYVVKSLGK